MATAMRSPGHAAGDAKRSVQGAATSPQFVLLARLGYVAKGAVYMIMGGLAARVAAGDGGSGATGSGAIDNKSALHAIYAEPFGQILLWVLAVGLIGYALFDFARALLDTEHEGSKPGALAKRVAFAAVGVVYTGLGIAAVHLATGSGSGKGSNASTQDWTERLLSLPYGKVLVILAGLVVIGFAVTQFKQAYSASFERKLSFDRVGEHLRRLVVACGRFGMGARAVVFVEIGIFLIVAAIHHDNKAAKGVGGALAELVKQPYGHVLLGIVALGFLAYGLYSLAEARYRRIATS